VISRDLTWLHHALMDKLAKDKKVDFEFKQEGGDYVVTSVK